MDYDIGMGIATFKIVLLLHVVIQTLIYYILTEILYSTRGYIPLSTYKEIWQDI